MKADKRIEELEKRVKELEQRPQIVVIPAQPYYPVQPFNPWPGYNPYTWPTVTCQSVASGYSAVIQTVKGGSGA